MAELGILIVGCGKIALANHLPGVALSGRARVVALCDSDPGVLESASTQTGITQTYGDFNEALKNPRVDAVIVATPNISHPPIVLACAAAGKHVLCEKPLALDAATAKSMLDACENANVRHMTAFTYRFVPAMRYFSQLVLSGAVGRPIHFRAQRFQDWADRNLGWRQVKKLAGTGELGDMLSHRIDYAHLLVGRFKRLVARMRNIVPMRQAQPNDTDDWVSILADLENDVTGVLESTKLATGRGEGYGGRDDVEINGTEGTIVYSTQSPHKLRIGRRDTTDLETVPVPKELLVHPRSPRDPSIGDPRVTFRYDQDIEFIDAILSNRECNPSLRAGVDVQTVMDAAVKSNDQRAWIEPSYLT